MNNINKMKELRIISGKKQKEVAKDLEVSQPTISDWESGRKMPSSKSAAALADYYKVSVDYILGREPSPRWIETSEIEELFYLLPQKFREEALSYMRYLVERLNAQ